jgi:trimeric autotransporter adhesin
MKYSINYSMRLKNHKYLVLGCIVYVSLLFPSCLDSINTGPFLSEGSGTESDPYRISTIEQLQAIDQDKYLNKHFIQVNDIDASETENYQRGSGFKFIGDPERPFTGTYNGNGYKIKDLRLHIQRSGRDHTGIFGYVKGGVIKNVTIENSPRSPAKLQELQHAYKSADFREGNLNSNDTDVFDSRGIGGLVGFNDGGVVSNCRFIGNVGGYISHSVGGLVGINTGLIEDSYFEGRVSAGASSGLVVINNGDIVNSHAKGWLGGMSAYGLVINNMGLITQSFTDADVNGTFRATGLVGFNNGLIKKSYSLGTAQSDHISAGLVTDNNGEIINSFSLTEINARYKDWSEDLFISGGLVGQNLENGLIIHSFFGGVLSVIGGDIGNDNIGGISGINHSSITASYWDTESTGQNQGVGEGNPDGATGLTTQQMTGQAAEAHMPEFDWVNVWRTTDGYPVLRWQEGE